MNNYNAEFIGRSGAGKSPYHKPFSKEFIPLCFDDLSFLCDTPTHSFLKEQTKLDRFFNFWKCKRNPSKRNNKVNRIIKIMNLHYSKAFEKSMREMRGIGHE